MEITVISEEENPMLHRTDVRFRVSHAEATPDRLAVRDSLAARLNKNADEVVIRKLDTKFGMRETVGEAKVYQGAEFAQDVEQAYMLARNKIGEEAEAAEAEVDEPEVETGEPATDADEEAAEAEVEADEPAEDEEAAADEGAEAEAADDEESDGDDAAEADAADDQDDAEETEE